MDIFRLPVIYLHHPVVMLLCVRPPRTHLASLKSKLFEVSATFKEKHYPLLLPLTYFSIPAATIPGKVAVINTLKSNGKYLKVMLLKEIIST